MQSLPTELVEEIFSHLVPNVHDISTLRIACSRFAKIGAGYHFHEICTFFDKRSLQKLIEFSENLKPQSHWFNGLDIHKTVRHVTFEDVVAIDEDLIEDRDQHVMDRLTPSRIATERFHLEHFFPQFRQALESSQESSLSRALRNLSNLRTLEFYPGLKMPRARLFEMRTDVQAYLQTKLRRDSWKSPTGLQGWRWANYVWILPFELKCYIQLSMAFQRIYGLLQDVSDNKLTSIVASTRLSGNMGSMEDERVWKSPSDRPVSWNVKRVELRYTHTPSRSTSSFYNDACLLSSPIAGFQQITHLTIVGTGLVRSTHLLLNGLRSPWPQLQHLRLENVAIVSTFVVWLMKHNIEVQIHNALFMAHCIGYFRNGSRLRSIQLSGLLVLRGRHCKSIWSSRPEDAVWIVESSKEDADALSQRTLQYCPTWIEVPLENVNYVDPKVIEEFFLGGGHVPLTAQNMWLRDKLYNWRVY